MASRFIIVGITASFAMLAIGRFGVAHAGGRAALSGSTTTFEIPDGWKRAPATSDVPTAILWLCRQGSAPQPRDQCTVRAEIDVAQERGLASLDARFAEWQALPAETLISPPRRFSLANQDAIEVVSKGQFLTHIRQEVVSDTIARKAGDGYYSCSLTLFEVSDYMALRGVVQSVCASLLAPQQSG